MNFKNGHFITKMPTSVKRKNWSILSTISYKLKNINVNFYTDSYNVSNHEI